MTVFKRHSKRGHLTGRFASLKKQAETLFRLICCEEKIMFRLKKNKLKDTDYMTSEHSPHWSTRAESWQLRFYILIKQFMHFNITINVAIGS